MSDSRGIFNEGRGDGGAGGGDMEPIVPVRANKDFDRVTSDEASGALPAPYVYAPPPVVENDSQSVGEEASDAAPQAIAHPKTPGKLLRYSAFGVGAVGVIVLLAITFFLIEHQHSRELAAAVSDARLEEQEAANGELLRVLQFYQVAHELARAQASQDLEDCRRAAMMNAQAAQYGLQADLESANRSRRLGENLNILGSFFGATDLGSSFVNQGRSAEYAAVSNYSEILRRDLQACQETARSSEVSVLPTPQDLAAAVGVSLHATE